MDDILKRLKNVRAEGCVTIILNTHRTRPDNERDPILLKNLVKEAEQRLHERFEKRFVWMIMDNLNKVVADVDHQQNLEGLMIFANSQVAEFTRLPVAVDDRVVIDNTFATRDIIRAMHSLVDYYILVLSRDSARLIEAFSDKPVHEITSGFPLSNDLYTTDRKKLSTNKGTDNLIEEFFNRVDKTLAGVLKEKNLPVIIATESRNVDYFTKVAESRGAIAGHLNRNHDEEQAHHIVPAAWEIMREVQNGRNEARLAELKSEVNSGRFLSDLNDIWQAVHEGRGRTIFVKTGYFVPAILEDGKLTPIDSTLEISEDKEVIDDAVDEIIEQNMKYGGDTVFLSGNELDNFQHLALTTRY